MNEHLYPFQRIGVRRIERFNGRALLADEMGLGKTCQAISWIRYYYKLKRPVLVVCPKSIKYNWANEIKRFGGGKLLPEVIDNGKAVSHFFRNRPHNTVYIINYDILNKWVELLSEQKIGLVIADECHYAKSRTAIRTKCLQYLARNVPHFIGISGTPLTNKPYELWPILNMIDPEMFPNFASFGRRYCNPRMTHWGLKYEGARRLPELHRKLKLSCMIRRKKNQVFKEMPPIQWSIIEVPLTNRKEYDLAEKDFKKWFIKFNPKKIKRGSRNEWQINMLTRYGYLRRLAGLGKIQPVKEWIENFLEESDGKLISFTVHKAAMNEYMKTFGYTSVKVDGGVTGAKRQKAFDQFTNDNKTRICFGQLIAAGVGWNGQVANTVIFPEFGDRPADHTQAAARAHRIGQKGHVQAIFFVAKGTIEEKIALNIQRKQNILDATLDGELQDDSFDLINLLEETYGEK